MSDYCTFVPTLVCFIKTGICNKEKAVIKKSQIRAEIIADPKHI